MKKVLFTMLVITGMTIVFTACDKEAEIAAIDVVALEKSLSPADVITNYNLLENPVISSASLEAEFALLRDGTVEEELPVELDESSGKLYFHQKMHDSLFILLSKLDLTKEQSIKIHIAMKEFHKCKMFNHALLRTHNQEIMLKINKERMMILEKLKKNEITKEQAEKALKELKMKAEQLFKNDPYRQKILDNLYKCHKEFIENLRYILTKEQWEKMMLYLKKVKV